MALSLAILLITAVYAKLATIGMPPNAGLKEPISPLRTALAQPLRLLLRSLLFVWGFHWVHQKGKKASAREAPVIAPNHICFVEPLALVSMNLPMSVGAYATMMFPGFSSVHRLLQNIPLEKYVRPKRTRARKNKLRQKRVALGGLHGAGGTSSTEECLFMAEAGS